MALHINLLHEELRRRRDRARDPLKFALALICLAGTGMVSYYTHIAAGVARTNRQLSQARSEWKRQEEISREATQDETRLTAKLDGRKRMIEMIENRMLWAPALATLASHVRPDVQLTRLFANATGTGTRRTVHIRVEGIAAGNEPRSTVEAFKVALEKAFSAASPETVATVISVTDLPEPLSPGQPDTRQTRFEIRCEIPPPPNAQKT